MSDISEWVKEKTGLEIREGVPYWIGIIAIFLTATWIRYIPAYNMQYLQALDPYMIARMSAGIVQNGFLPAVDVVRFFPFPTPTHTLNLGNIYIPAYLYSLVKPFGMKFLAWAKAYPALMGGITVIPVYLMVSEVFNRRTGLLSGFFLASSVAVLRRSSAGWFEKEPIALLLMMFSLYFFVRGWKRKSWISGIFSGIFLGLAGISWGGSLFLMLFYPVVVGSLVVGIPILMVLLSLIFEIDVKPLDNIEGIVAAYTPIVILGMGLPFVLNFSASFNASASFANIGILIFLLLRYLAEKKQFVEKKNLPTFSISLVGIGLVLLIFSPIIAPSVSNYVGSAVNKITQSSVGVIGSTVAENQPSNLNSVVGRLGATQSANIVPGARYFSEFFSGWTFGIIGMSILGLLVFLEFLRHYFDVESIDYSTLLGGYLISVSLSSAIMFYSFARSFAFAFTPAMIITGLVCFVIYLFHYTQSEESQQWYKVSMFIWALLFVLTAFIGSMGAMTFLGAVGGVMILWSKPMGRKFEVQEGWLYLVFFAWMASTIYGAIQKSRLLFLAATPVAVCAGIGFSKIIDAVAGMEIWEWVNNKQSDVDINISPKKFFIVLVLILLVVVNVSAAYIMANNSVGGSPNQGWMQNLEYMREETPKGSVILSWWDYGYWFQTIGDRTAIADGGNMAYYTGGNNMSKVNNRLADFLTSSNASKYRGWLDERSVDYITLDRTMIGKYSAVSTISNRGEETNSMLDMGCMKRDTSRGQRCVQSRINNNTVLRYSDRRLNRLSQRGRAEVLVPIGQGEDGNLNMSGAALVKIGQNIISVANLCTDEGIVRVTEKEGTKGGVFQALVKSFRNDRPFGGCVAFNPHRRGQRLVLVPPNIMDSTLVRLYLMDGAGIDFVDKVFDNGFSKTWEVEEAG